MKKGIIKNAEIWATENCNSRCLICDAWKRKSNQPECSPLDLKRLLSEKDFQSLESVQISGGEPMLRKDMNEIIDAITACLPRLKKLTLTSNGTYPQRILRLFKNFRQYETVDFKLCLSLEGPRDIHNKIRGIKGYSLILETVALIKKQLPRVNITLLTTLNSENCDDESLSHVKALAESFKINHSFRPFYSSDTHHYSENVLSLNSKQKVFLVKFINNNYPDNDFLLAQAEYLKSGKMRFVDTCRAGGIFVNIRSNGDIFPCINSKRKIGDIEQGLYKEKISNLGEYEQCSICCDEACFYPMLNYGND